MDDLISRQAAIDAFLTLGFVWDDSLSDVEKEELDYAIHGIIMAYKERIEKIPSVQPERNFLSGLSAEEQYDKIKWLFDYGKEFTDSRLAVIEWLEKHSAQSERTGNKVNLCDSCRHTYPDCNQTDVIFGDGVGHDNICCCGMYQPERKKGKWIKNDNGTYSCDQCRSWIPEEQHYYAQYCLYCGADMRGEQ